MILRATGKYEYVTCANCRLSQFVKGFPKIKSKEIACPFCGHVVNYVNWGLTRVRRNWVPNAIFRILCPCTIARWPFRSILTMEPDDFSCKRYQNI